MQKRYYVTTAIDYVNDVIHIGHAFQKIVADVLARFWRIQLGEENVFFLTGTDEYGQKAAKAAKAAGLSPKDFTDKISKSDRLQQDSLNISYDRFIRTTDSDHLLAVQEIWKRVDKNGDIYLGKYTGLYCEGCEAYYTEDDLTGGKCPFHPNLEIKKVTEENYFFRWSSYKEFLIKNLKENPNFVIPKSRGNEMLEFAKNIKDIPISRSNFSWGVPVPNDEKQVIYVWFDALTNYITGVGFPKDEKLFKKFWPADVHILGKDNVRWHALLWPAILKSAGLPVPKAILVNGFLNLNGRKISKSLGNIIRPTEWVEKYGADAVRFYLLKYTTITEDGDISEEKLKNAYNGDLADGLGNLVSRVAKLVETYKPLYEKREIADFSEHVIVNIQRYKLNEALDAIWVQIKNLNLRLNEWEPWKETGIRSPAHWGELVNGIRQVAYDLQPFLPEPSSKILKQFSASEIKAGRPLFPKIR